MVGEPATSENEQERGRKKRSIDRLKRLADVGVKICLAVSTIYYSPIL